MRCGRADKASEAFGSITLNENSKLQRGAEIIVGFRTIAS